MVLNLFARTLIVLAEKDLNSGGLSKLVASQLMSLGTILRMQEDIEK